MQTIENLLLEHVSKKSSIRFLNPSKGKPFSCIYVACRAESIDAPLVSSHFTGFTQVQLSNSIYSTRSFLPPNMKINRKTMEETTKSLHRTSSQSTFWQMFNSNSSQKSGCGPFRKYWWLTHIKNPLTIAQSASMNCGKCRSSNLKMFSKIWNIRS